MAMEDSQSIPGPLWVVSTVPVPPALKGKGGSEKGLL